MANARGRGIRAARRNRRNHAAQTARDSSCKRTRHGPPGVRAATILPKPRTPESLQPTQPETGALTSPSSPTEMARNKTSRLGSKREDLAEPKNSQALTLNAQKKLTRSAEAITPGERAGRLRPQRPPHPQPTKTQLWSKRLRPQALRPWKSPRANPHRIQPTPMQPRAKSAPAVESKRPNPSKAKPSPRASASAGATAASRLARRAQARALRHTTRSNLLNERACNKCNYPQISRGCSCPHTRLKCPLAGLGWRRGRALRRRRRHMEMHIARTPRPLHLRFRASRQDLLAAGRARRNLPHHRRQDLDGSSVPRRCERFSNSNTSKPRTH